MRCKITYLVLCLVTFCSAQSKYEIIDYLRHSEFHKASDALKTSKTLQNGTKYLLKFQVDLYKSFNSIELDKYFIEESNLSNDLKSFDRFYYHMATGDTFFFNYPNKDIEAISSYKSALNEATSKNDSILICEALKKILFVHRISFLVDNSTYEEYLKMYKKYAYDALEETYLNYYDLSFKFKNFYVKKWDKNIEFYLLEKSTDIGTPPYLKGKIKQLVGFYYEMIGEFSRSEKLYDEVLVLFEGLNFDYVAYDRKTTLIYKAILEVNREKPEKAIYYLNQAKSDKTDKLFTINRMYIDYWASQANYKLANYKAAYDYNSSYEYLRDSLNEFKYSTILTELETKYQTTEKEKQILVEQQKKKQNRNIALTLGGLLLLFGSLIFYLVQKNTTKKRKLAEQQQLLEQQKVATLLKEQELSSIDAMIAGQEKERTKVANELHDDLGSLMATVKLHFDNVKVDQKDPALINAQKLLDEAYQKIRGMAHSKNSGVMANQGLLPAVKKMAKTINETNSLKVTVEDFGLGERMENSLELTIFRIIQELIANIIKHSKAHTATIQFTQHEDRLNIIVEDNGGGFDMAAVMRSQNGMGLGTIEKRIEHLEGTFTVDSVIGKGTSILIDIPI